MLDYLDVKLSELKKGVLKLILEDEQVANLVKFIKEARKQTMF